MLSLKELSVSKEELDSPVIDFDISSSGKILLVLKDDRIIILNEKGNLIQAFSFDTYGSVYACFNDENIQLFLIRSSVVIEFTLEGALIQIVGLDQGSSETTRFIQQLDDMTPIKFEEKEYRLERGSGIFDVVSMSYSKLIVQNENGERVVLYDVSNSHSITSVIVLLFFILVFGVVIVKVVWRYRKHK